MRCARQLVATHRDGFRLPEPFVARPFATGCHWLRPLGSIKAPYTESESLVRPRLPGCPGTTARCATRAADTAREARAPVGLRDHESPASRKDLAAGR